MASPAIPPSHKCRKRGWSRPDLADANRRRSKHGWANKRLSQIFDDMRGRCYNPNTRSFQWYGARGIRICPEWLEDRSVFYAWAVANGYRDDLMIERIDTEGHYEPTNCKWATAKEQQNNRRNNRLLTVNGEKLTMMQWSERTGIRYNVLHKRWSDGRTPEEVVHKGKLKRRCKHVWCAAGGLPEERSR
jgi:hypothetical protein